jgi:hypothetical protein
LSLHFSKVKIFFFKIYLYFFKYKNVFWNLLVKLMTRENVLVSFCTLSQVPGVHIPWSEKHRSKITEVWIGNTLETVTNVPFMTLSGLSFSFAYIHLFIPFFLFCWQYWGLNSGPWGLSKKVLYHLSHTDIPAHAHLMMLMMGYPFWVSLFYHWTYFFFLPVLRFELRALWLADALKLEPHSPVLAFFLVF